jgi:hypothetical protein
MDDVKSGDNKHDNVNRMAVIKIVKMVYDDKEDDDSILMM